MIFQIKNDITDLIFFASDCFETPNSTKIR